MRSRVLTSASTLLLLALPVIAADGGISHEKLGCVPPGGNARIVADLPSADAPVSVRTYFRVRESKDDYYIEMLRGQNDRYWGVLPVTTGKAGPVSYRVVAKLASGRELTTGTYAVPVAQPCAVQLTEDEARFARNLVIGQSKPALPDVPFGFECVGIGGRISSDGELRAISPCAQLAAAARSAAANPGPRGTVSALPGGVTAAGNPCEGCTPADGSLTLGGKGGVGVPGGVIPPPVSPSRPKN